MNKLLRYSFVALLAMVFGNVSAADVVIDFNKMDLATSTNDSNAGDINEAKTFEQDGVTIVISPKTEEATNPNRFWKTNNGPQLRCYSGTITISGTNMKTITFDNGKWNNGNTANVGSLSAGKWTSDEGQSSVIITIAGNTQINKITISANASEPSEPETYTLVGAGTLDKPFTASDAIYLANKGEYASEEVYITGKIFKVNTTDANIEKYGNIDYFISEDGQEAQPSFEIFRGKYFGGEAFTVDNKVKVGDEVVVKGKLAMYNTQAETAQGAVLVKLNGNTSNISAIRADIQNGAIYNVAGQMVTSSYKGLVIKDGKKFVVK